MDPRVAPEAARFGDVADRYERARPLYPEAVLSELAARCGVRSGTPVVDLGAGTGKLTRQVAALGADVVAVEPAAGMRRRFEAEVPGVPVLDGTAEAIPLPDASVETVTVGQAFHWFDTHRALEEVARVLRPAGWLALLWNERPESGWAAGLWDLRQRLTGAAAGTYPAADGPRFWPPTSGSVPGRRASTTSWSRPPSTRSWPTAHRAAACTSSTSPGGSGSSTTCAGSWTPTRRPPAGAS
jgi:SAM-dependent methyltransferase